MSTYGISNISQPVIFGVPLDTLINIIHCNAYDADSNIFFHLVF